MRITLFLLLLGSFALPISLQAEEDRFKYVMCRNRKIVRTIRVEWNKETAGCEATYTKSGVDRSIGNGKFYESCVKFLGNVQTNLEKAGWKCKDISNTTIHREIKVKKEETKSDD